MIEETEAAVLRELGSPIQLVSLKLPEMKPGQILVDVAYSGLCHTQLLEARGLRGEDRFLPHTLGHEGAGTVIDIGAGVTKVQPGDRVVLSWIKGIGADVPSTTYLSDDGPVNGGALTTFMRHTFTCENRVTRIPDAMPFREAALLGCAIPTGAGVVINQARVRPGSSVAVFGLGGIGQSALMACTLMNAATIIGIDLFDHKLELAVHFGATHTINAKHQDPLSNVRDITGGNGVDYVIEATGNSKAMETAFQCVRDNGGLCVLAGNPPLGERISIDPFDLIRGKQIVGTWGGETKPDRDIPMYAEFYLANKLNLDEMISRVYSLGDINQALNDLEEGKVVRGIIEC